MKHAVICIVPNRFQAEVIIFSLKDAGFLNTQISVLMPNMRGVRDIGDEKRSKILEVVSTSVSPDALIDGAFSWLTELRAFVIPGIGPFVTAGPILAALGGRAIGAATGGVSGSLIGLGVPEYEARQYEGKLLEGNILVSIHTEERYEAKRAEDIFKVAGARDVKRTGVEAVKIA